MAGPERFAGAGPPLSLYLPWVLEPLEVAGKSSGFQMVLCPQKPAGHTSSSTFKPAEKACRLSDLIWAVSKTGGSCDRPVSFQRLPQAPGICWSLLLSRNMIAFLGMRCPGAWAGLSLVELRPHKRGKAHVPNLESGRQAISPTPVWTA